MKKDFVASVKDVLASVKSKKVLTSLDDDFVREKIVFYADKYHLAYSNPKSASYKQLVKLVREDLHLIYGVFQLSEKEDLSSHVSSKERLRFYSLIYERIFNITGKPTTILDIACGLNPYSYSYLGCTPTYYACELTSFDCERINSYFKKNNIKGECFTCDVIQDYKKLLKYPVDMVFLFKILDFLNFETIIWFFEHLKTKYLVVSFSTHSLCGKRFLKERTWFDHFLEDYEYETFAIPNEKFYVIKIR